MELENPSFLWFLDLADVTMTPQTNYSLFLSHHDTLKSPRKAPTHFQNITFGKLRISKLGDFENERSNNFGFIEARILKF